MRVSLVLGTRPEIIKMTSIIKHLKSGRYSYDYDVVHTEQHYDLNMSEKFFDEFGLPQPDYRLNVGSGTQAQQTANAMMKLEEVFLETSPDVVLVQGDTNTVLAGALSAAKLGIKVGHVEAGLRSQDLRMPEEHNRRLADHLSSFLFAPTEFNAKTLRGENVWGEISVTGNTAIDACMEYLPVAEEKSRILEDIEVEDFVLVTAHRSENVDDPKVLGNLFKIFTECPLPVVYPLHPRTKKKLKESGLYDRLVSHRNVQIIDPVGYFDFLVLMKSCSFIMTDSGGIQEEATAPNIRKKVFVLRYSTERPEAVEAGYAEVLGTDSERVLRRISKFIEYQNFSAQYCPFGEGKSGKTILTAIEAITKKF
ncbi:MAG TPA: UDP-N-acetylglucosamine 2-epimerase (non-hydrolyzing) [Methanothrix sp.]|nr:UDP-N-acetylglucosamine 2-epimerase (non-hydrolyzing) [Methanothrix sp.]HPJ83238.1 UDP-N-acetylglucosamine 2-epimerase (non-hydrolyzing) [Methanothrix sp.]